MDNYATHKAPKIKAWLTRRPHYHAAVAAAEVVRMIRPHADRIKQRGVAYWHNTAG